jgi:predicted ester cyclase
MSETSTTSKTERNKANYLAAKEAFNNNDLPNCLRYYSLDHEVKSVPGEKGRHVIQHFFESMHAMWGGITITVEHVVAEDNWVMGRSMATATHSKTVLGVPPTDKQITAAFWDLHFFNEDGMITQTWNMIDNAAILKQIGVLPK